MLKQPLTFGEKIRELRLQKGWTQSQVADAIKVSAQAYSRWERDERQPSYDLLAELLFALGNPEFRIKDKEIKIGDDLMTPVRKYLEIPSYEEVLEQYQTIVTQTQHLTTIEAIQAFAISHSDYLIEINYDALSEVSPGSDLEVVRYEYKNLLIYATVQEGVVEYYPWMTLYDDEGNQFDDRPYLIEHEYWSEIEGVVSLRPQWFTLNPDYPH